MRRLPMLAVLVLLTLLQGLGPLLHAHRGGPPDEGAIHVHALPSGVAASDTACGATVRVALQHAPDALVTPVDGLEAPDAPVPVADGAVAPRCAPPVASAAVRAAIPPPARAPPTPLAWLHPPTQAPPRS